MAEYFIADLHFGHRNMAIKRGFKDENEHDEFIIQMWNSVVTKRDVVTIIGDVTMEKSANYILLNRLNGIKRVILGNHDMQNHVPKLLLHVNSVAGMVKKKFHEERLTVFITHCPIHPREFRKGRVKLNIHGHIHEYKVKKFFNLIEDKRYINVSCEQIDYMPRTIKELLTLNNIKL